MDRNMRSSYINSGPRSLPHMGNNKRHNNGNGHFSNGHNGARLSPPDQNPDVRATYTNQQDDIINYVYDSWNKATRIPERGSAQDAKYYQEVLAPRQLANFRPFNLEEWWARRLLQNINRSKHRC